jgi:hypothetical protein
MVTARHTTYNAQREAPNNPPAVAKTTGCNRRLSEVLPVASCFSAARRRAISEVMLRAVGTAPLPDATCAADADASWHTRKADWRGTEGIGCAVSERGHRVLPEGGRRRQLIRWLRQADGAFRASAGKRNASDASKRGKPTDVYLA